ncbi:MAG: alpha/beta fold hydrolase [Gammaproteobacteria bacterium]|nr:MAG: alpha/beta fold hydrolase [Gammaproteobacteria bacterium]
MEPGRGENRRHLEQARDAVLDLVAEQEAAGIPPGQVVLAGFSQGGVIALLAALASERRLAGVMGLSTYLPLPDTAPLPCRGLPTFLAHGDLDEVLPFFLGVRARDRLRAAGCAVTWHEYPMGHAVCTEEIAHIGQWLGRVLQDGMETG